MRLPRVLVVGAGGVGGWYAGQLAGAGCEVTLVARGAHGAALRAHGLRVRLPDGSERTHAVGVCEDPRETGIADLVVSAMMAEGAAGVVFRREIANAEDPEAKRAELVQHYRDAFSTPYVAAARGQVDAIIEPAETRRYIARALEMLAGKRELRPAKKHGLIPL